MSELILNFVFSSRSRHTSFSHDWSSDVCSSDLLRVAVSVTAERRPRRRLEHVAHLTASHSRSEERRVGKECRCRWAPIPESCKKYAGHLYLALTEITSTLYHLRERELYETDTGI